MCSQVHELAPDKDELAAALLAALMELLAPEVDASEPDELEVSSSEASELELDQEQLGRDRKLVERVHDEQVEQVDCVSPQRESADLTRSRHIRQI